MIRGVSSRGWIVQKRSVVRRPGARFMSAFMALLVAVALGVAGATAASVSNLRIRVETGGVELAAGSVLELHIYQAGRPVIDLPLTHGESWPGASTHVIPVTLTEPLDPRAVLRFGLYYRAAGSPAPSLEVVAVDVEMSASGSPPERLLNATLAGTIASRGELDTADRDASMLRCNSDADCDDHRSCDGQERCAPRAAGADARGCVAGSPKTCPVNQVCSERQGCHGLDASAPR